VKDRASFYLKFFASAVYTQVVYKMTNNGIKDVKSFLDMEELNYREMVQYADLEVKHKKVLK